MKKCLNKKKFSRIFAVLFAFCVFISSLCLSAFAETDYTVPGGEYSLKPVFFEGYVSNQDDPIFNVNLYVEAPQDFSPEVISVCAGSEYCLYTFYLYNDYIISFYDSYIDISHVEFGCRDISYSDITISEDIYDATDSEVTLYEFMSSCTSFGDPLGDPDTSEPVDPGEPNDPDVPPVTDPNVFKGFYHTLYDIVVEYIYGGEELALDMRLSASLFATGLSFVCVTFPIIIVVALTKFLFNLLRFI